MKKLGALFLTCLLSGCAVDQVVSGEEAFRAGQYDQAATHWNPPAYAGDLRAQYYLGVLWDNGYGSTPVNASEAAEWYSRAARQGHVDAMVALSRIQLQSGYRDEAVSWLVLAARNGNGEAVYKLQELGLPVPPQDLYQQRMVDDAHLRRQQEIATQQAVEAAEELGAALGGLK